MGMVALRPRGPISYPASAGGAFAATRCVREVGPATAPKPRLLDRVREAVRIRHYSRRTEKAYVHWIKRYIFFHGKRHPIEMGAAEVTAFLTSLAMHSKVAASTQNQALSALLFLYREVLVVELPWLDDVVRAKRPLHLPVALTRDEVRAVLQRLDGVPRLMAILLYGAGLRLLECCRLRVKDIDFAMHEITIRDGKGSKGSADDAAGHGQGGAGRPHRARARTTSSRPQARRRLGYPGGAAITSTNRSSSGL
jgi:integrase